MNANEGEFTTDKIGLACYMMIKGSQLIGVKVKNKGRASFSFNVTLAEGVAYESAYTTSEHSRFFEAFKYLRARALKGG